MVKSELVQRVSARNSDILVREVESVVDAILEEVAEALSKGQRVELRGFGAFSVKKRLPRLGRNPRTGDSVSVGEKFAPVFRTGKGLRDWLNASQAV